ncbi:MAG: 50S ribosomal protein L31 [Candidatus Lightella neohaematopini]|nr:50S ribosomal protein L31 [Candidatus Lightella neohaematopini]
MKKNVHPNYNTIIVTCVCGNQINIKSTICNDINIDVCNKCHPFYTGKQRLLDNIGRVSIFNKRFNAYYK